jgi:serine/threonine-protein kinase
MTLREKFGRLVLLEETDSSPLGNEYRAARLGPSGFDRLVTVLRFSQAVSADAEGTKRLVEEARLAAQIHSPGLVKMLGVGRVGPSFYLSTELVEGRSVRAVLESCREGGFPFGADHALMIASRTAAGLEALHGRKDEAGQPLLHGLIGPRQLIVAFDGEVKVKGLGLWPALGQTGLLPPEERAYLAPEQATGRGDERSDVYALGLVLLETLSGQATDGSDPLQRIPAARIVPPGGEPGPLPTPLASLLRRALAADPAARFPRISELRRGIDALLFSGDFTPTTFDLAFFMHTLFREDVEGDARAVEEARGADYSDLLADEAAKAQPAASPQTEPVDAQPAPPPPVEAPASAPTEVPAPTVPDPAARPASPALPLVPPPRPAAPVAPAVLAAPAAPAAAAAATAADARSSARVARESVARESVARESVVREASAREASAREASAREAASRIALGGTAAAGTRRRPSPGQWGAIGLAVVLLGGGVAGWVYFAGRRAAVTAARAAEQVAAEARVRELETRIAQLETEKAAAESRAAEEARLALEKQAAAGGQTADPAAIERAQEEARRRARLEQERQQQEELQRLANEKRAEEQRLAAAAAAPAAAAPPTPLPTPTPVPVEFVPLAPPLAAGPASSASAGPASQPQSQEPTTQATPGLPVAATAQATGRIAPADPSDPAVRAPGLLSEDPVPYPRRAAAVRLATTVVVVVRALIDETGRVTEAAITQASGQPPEMGFDDAAFKRVRSRKYRPARRHDIPMPIWVVIRVEFRPPAQR